MSRQLEINGVSWCSCEFNPSCWFWGLAFRSVVLDTDHQFFSQKKEKNTYVQHFQAPILCVQSSRVTWEKCFCTFIQPPLQGQDSCSSHRDHCGEAHRTSSLFLPKQDSCILQQTRRQDVQLWPQGTDSFSREVPGTSLHIPNHCHPYQRDGKDTWDKTCKSTSHVHCCFQLPCLYLIRPSLPKAPSIVQKKCIFLLISLHIHHSMKHKLISSLRPNVTGTDKVSLVLISHKAAYY